MPARDKKTLDLEICTIDRVPVRLEAKEVSAPGTLGVFVVLPGHAPLLSTLDIGVLKAWLTDGRQCCFAINGGFAQVLDNRVLILTQTAEAHTEIDVPRAEAARERAEKRLRGGDKSMDFARAEVALKRSLARIRAAREATIDATASRSHQPKE